MSRGRSYSETDLFKDREAEEQKQPAAPAITQPTNPDELQVGDVLIFKIPPTKPSLADRFIRFAQKLKGNAHPEDADAVHTAIVTKGGANPQVAHYTKHGLKTGDLLLGSAYAKHFESNSYEIFRSETFKENMKKIISSASEGKETHPKTDAVEKTNYSFLKMAAAFLRGENKLPDRVRKSLPEKITQQGYDEHVCSTFVAKVIKDAQKGSDNLNQPTLETSYLLPAKLFAKLKSDKVNFQRIVPTDTAKCKVLMDLVDTISSRLEEQMKSTTNPAQKEKIQQKIADINAAKKVFANNGVTDPKILMSIMVGPLAADTSLASNSIQPHFALIFLKEAKNLGLDTSKHEKALHDKAVPATPAPAKAIAPAVDTSNNDERAPSPRSPRGK